MRRLSVLLRNFKCLIVFYQIHDPIPSILINVQRHATMCKLYFILLQYHTTCFGCCPHPSTGVHKTVVTVTSTSNMIVQLPHYNVANLATLVWSSCTIIWLVPVTVTTVLCTHDDGCGRHPKHVEWYCSKIKYKLHIVASRWTFININLWCTETWTWKKKTLII